MHCAVLNSDLLELNWKKLTCIESPGYFSGFQDNRFSVLANCTNCCCWNFSVGSISTRATACGQGHVANRWKKLCMTLVASNPPKDEKLFSYRETEIKSSFILTINQSIPVSLNRTENNHSQWWTAFQIFSLSIHWNCHPARQCFVCHGNNWINGKTGGIELPITIFYL